MLNFHFHCWVSTRDFQKGLKEQKRKRSKSFERRTAFKGTVIRSVEKLSIHAFLFYFQYIL